ncbi:AraC family transcriptional regulator [Streptococcus dentasini]
MDIEAITAYMAEHLADDISLEKVAQHFHYAPSYFSRQFKTVTGVTFCKYLESMRIQGRDEKVIGRRRQYNAYCWSGWLRL